MHLLRSTLFAFCLGNYLLASAAGKLSFETHLQHDNSSNRNATITVDWENALAKADAFVAKLNLAEKVSMVTGASGSCIGNIAPIARLGFPGLCISDGPTADNRADLVSIFPAGLTVAASWDTSLMYWRGFAVGSEFREKGTHVGLGPVAGPLGRHPLGGRNWEGFSPDPYLTGVAMTSTVTGMQNAGVQSCSKHFIGNEQETQRSNSISTDGTDIEAISSNIDDRTLHELYLWPFADAVKAGTTSVMCSYNRLNETYSCENSALLNGILKTELGFQGYVMSDFFATHSGVKSANGGLDMNMPGSTNQAAIGTGDSYFGSNLVEAVSNGSVFMSRIDDMFGVSLGYKDVPARDVRGDHAPFIRKLGAAGTVLLKNLKSTLPLRSPQNIGVFGNDAPDLTGGLTFQDPLPPGGFEFGTLDIGGGSGSGRHTSIVSPLEAIKARANLTGARVQYITDNTILAANKFGNIYPTPDVCLVFLKTFAGEGMDRLSFELDWNSTLVVNNVAKHCPNTVVITHSAGVNTMPWSSNLNVTAILAVHYLGEESGNSIVDILWGDVNPSGKLPYTIPVTEADYHVPIVNLTNATSPNAWQSDFTDGLFIDYRHFDAKNITPLYEFGYGLSYTTFNITSLLTIKTLVSKPCELPNASLPIAPGGNTDLWTELLSLSTSVSNTGHVEGAAVVQLYLSLPQDFVPSGTPIKVLRGFRKINLKPEENTGVKFLIARRDISFWDTTLQQWRLAKGKMIFSVGFSSRDLKESAEVQLL